MRYVALAGGWQAGAGFATRWQAGMKLRKPNPPSAERTLAAYLPCLRGKHAMCQTGLTLVSLFMRESVSGTGK